MNIEDKHALHSLIGGMTSDYFDFFCKKCGAHIGSVDFYGLDDVGVMLAAKCGGCGAASVFKIKVTIELGPVQTTWERGGYTVKAYDQRKLKKYKREVEERIAGKKKGTS